MNKHHFHQHKNRQTFPLTNNDFSGHHIPVVNLPVPRNLRHPFASLWRMYGMSCQSGSSLALVADSLAAWVSQRWHSANQGKLHCISIFMERNELYIFWRGHIDKWSTFCQKALVSQTLFWNDFCWVIQALNWRKWTLGAFVEAFVQFAEHSQPWLTIAYWQ